MKAVIMAGGFGTRLRPLTSNIPKPMVPMVNKPMMEHIVDLLKSHKITDIISALYYQPEIITSYFGNGDSFGIKMQYKKAEADYGTAGSVRNVKSFLDERFIIISGDVLTDFDLSDAIKFHQEKGAKATILLTRVHNPLQYGVVLTHSDGKISKFLEKPSWGEVFSDTINTGIYILEPEVLDLIPEKQMFDFSKDLFPAMLEKDLGLYGYIAKGYWKDIGSLHEYQDAHMDILRNEVHLKIEGAKKEHIVCGEGSIIETDKHNITGYNIIGKNCHVHNGVVLSNSIVGDNCEIYPGTVIRNSIIWHDSVIGSRSEISLDVIGSKCIIGDDVIISENVFIGDVCTIGKRSKLLSNIKIWPEKFVEDGSTVTRSLVWEDRWLRELFTDARITGISNIEINPEFGAKLGAAFGVLVGQGSSIVTSRDSDNVSRMINRAIMSGLMSAGVNCVDLRTTSIPIVRHELRTGNERGGIHVRKSPFDKNSTDIIFFDVKGKDLPTKKTKDLDRLFFGEDFKRCHYEQVGSISFPERTTESYVQRFLETLNTDIIRSAGLKMVIDYSNGIASTIFPNILGNMDVQIVALNGYLDSKKITKTKEEFDESLNQLSYVVTSLKYDIGVLLDAGAEKIFIIDEQGKMIDSDRLLTLMLKYLIITNKEINKIAVPISASGEIDLIAKEYNIEVVKTRDSHLALMDAATDKNIKFVGGTKGGFIFNEFIFASDGMYSISKLLECIAKSKKRICELDKETPHLYFVKKNIPCPWHKKGSIMRKITELSADIPRDLIDGIKLYPKNTAEHTSILLNPDKSRPVFHINAESSDINVAKKLVEEYENLINEWLNNYKN